MTLLIWRREGHLACKIICFLWVCPAPGKCSRRNGSLATACRIAQESRCGEKVQVQFQNMHGHLGYLCNASSLEWQIHHPNRITFFLVGRNKTLYCCRLMYNTATDQRLTVTCELPVITVGDACMQHKEQTVVLRVRHVGNFQVDLQEPARDDWHHGSSAGSL